MPDPLKTYHKLPRDRGPVLFWFSSNLFLKTLNQTMSPNMLVSEQRVELAEFHSLNFPSPN